MDEEEYSSILKFLKNGIYPLGLKLSKTRKRNFRRKCAPFQAEAETLFYISSKNNVDARLKVIKKGNTRKIIENTHSPEHGGHLGIHKT